MPPMSAGNSNLQDLHEWCAEFNEVREPLRGYSQVYIRTLTNTNTNTDTDDIALFTDADDPGQMPNLEAETILSFCRSVRSSNAFNKNPPKRLVAVIHESDSMGNSRGANCPLAATQLHQSLLIPVSLHTTLAMIYRYISHLHSLTYHVLAIRSEASSIELYG